MTALRAACLARGVCIEEQSPVNSISITSTDAQIADHHARFAILAAGAWSSSISVTIDGQPYRASPLLPDQRPSPRLSPSARIAPRHRPPRSHVRPPARRRFHHRRLLHRRRRIRPHNRSRNCFGIAARAAALIPALRDHKPESVWIGFRPATDSPAPNIGRVSPAAFGSPMATTATASCSPRPPAIASAAKSRAALE